MVHRAGPVSQSPHQRLSQEEDESSGGLAKQRGRWDLERMERQRHQNISTHDSDCVVSCGDTPKERQKLHQSSLGIVKSSFAPTTSYSVSTRLIANPLVPVSHSRNNQSTCTGHWVVDRTADWTRTPSVEYISIHDLFLCRGLSKWGEEVSGVFFR